MSFTIDIAEQEIDNDLMMYLRDKYAYDEEDNSADEEIAGLEGSEMLTQILNYLGTPSNLEDICQAVKIAYGIDLEDYPFNAHPPKRIYR